MYSPNDDKNAAVKDDKEILSYEHGDLISQNTKIKMQTADQQRHVLRMLEKSLAREMDLEKKLTELRQAEDNLKFRLQQEMYSNEEEAEVLWERLFEAENTAEVLLSISKDLLGRLQIVQLNLNGSIQREGEFRSELKNLHEELKNRDIELQKSESSRTKLMDKVISLEKRLKEYEFQLQTDQESVQQTQRSNSMVQEAEDMILLLKKQASEAEKGAESAEAECKLLGDSNMELNTELNLLKSSISSTSDRVDQLQRQLNQSEIQRQHAVASAEAIQEKQSMLYSTIGDMENLIEDLKLKVSKAESETDSAENKCIILSESNADLNEEINFLRCRVESLEASLRQAEEVMTTTGKNIVVRTKLLSDSMVQLSVERERLHKQISSLTKEKKVAQKLLRQILKDPSVAVKMRTANKGKEFISTNKAPVSGISTKERKEEATGSSASSCEAGHTPEDVFMSDVKMKDADSNSKLDSVRNIDPRQQLDLKNAAIVILGVLVASLVFCLKVYFNKCHPPRSGDITCDILCSIFECRRHNSDGAA